MRGRDLGRPESRGERVTLDVLIKTKERFGNFLRRATGRARLVEEGYALYTFLPHERFRFAADTDCWFCLYPCKFHGDYSLPACGGGAGMGAHCLDRAMRCHDRARDLGTALCGNARLCACRRRHTRCLADPIIPRDGGYPDGRRRRIRGLRSGTLERTTGGRDHWQRDRVGQLPCHSGSWPERPSDLA